MIKKQLIAAAFGCATLLSSCGSSHGEFSVISTKSFDARALNGNMPVGGEIASGSDGQFNILFIGLGRPELDEAVNSALKKGKGDVIVNAKVSTSWWSILLIGGESIKVKGKVIDTKKSGNYMPSPAAL